MLEKLAIEHGSWFLKPLQSVSLAIISGVIIPVLVETGKAECITGITIMILTVNYCVAYCAGTERQEAILTP